MIVNETAVKQILNEVQPATLVAATKYVDEKEIEKLEALGVQCFGENRVQAFLDKYEKYHGQGDFHFIGTLQPNKVKYIIDKVKLIHAVDRYSLMKEIEKQAAKHDLVMPVLIQVNIAKEESKHGFEVEEIDEVFQQVQQYKHIDVKGDSIIDINGKAITYQNNEWSSNATPDVKRVGNAMMRNSIGQTQFEKMMWSDYPITITLSSKDDNNSGRIGVTSITGDENGNITKAKITLYMEIIKDIANIIPYAKQGEIVKRYRENLNIDQLSNITLDDVIGATGTHESVHALDKYSNHVGQPDKSKREQNPILKEIEYIKKIKH